MRSNNYKSVRQHAGLAASVLLLASGAAFGQQQINLSAGLSGATMPDGTFVPMWGYTCGAAVAPGGSCAIQVTFTPATAGPRSATISIPDNAPGAPHTVALTGSGVGLTITPQTAVVVSTQTQQFTPSGGSGTVVPE